jgi:hypothetical protein
MRISTAASMERRLAAPIRGQRRRQKKQVNETSEIGKGKNEAICTMSLYGMVTSAINSL